ncbi:hypothetical protein KIPB_010270 [Kipferlia bialata]|uniref:Uncharacterized protein n=1 Tax=Kipferlia bialata TaxID=797122 RepID=A0A9K3D2U4_9EUKA|nr:hypothetical protein KIPB_010270 [Kipferlia bialata]|eukprot:g10270.t1
MTEQYDEEPVPPHSLDPLSPDSAQLVSGQNGAASQLPPMPKKFAKYHPEKRDTSLLMNILRIFVFLASVALGVFLGLVLLQVVTDSEYLWPFGRDIETPTEYDDANTGDDTTPDTEPDLIELDLPSRLTDYMQQRKDLAVWSPSLDKRIDGEHPWHLLLQNAEGSGARLASMCHMHGVTAAYIFVGSVYWDWAGYYRTGTLPYKSGLQTLAGLLAGTIDTDVTVPVCGDLILSLEGGCYGTEIEAIQ